MSPLAELYVRRREAQARLDEVLSLLTQWESVDEELLKQRAELLESEIDLAEEKLVKLKECSDD